MADVAEAAPAEQQVLPSSYSGDVRFTSPKVAPSYLGDTLSDRYNTSWLEWSPETIWQTIEQDFMTEIHPVVKEKIGAVQTLLNTDDFWREWHIFEKVCKAFNSVIPNFTMMEPCSPGEMALAVEEAAKLRKYPFSPEVIAYVRANCLSHGMAVFPVQLMFAQGGLQTELEKKVSGAWAEASTSPTFPVEEDEIGVQLARLNAIRHYIKSEQGEAEQVTLKAQKRW
jgi:hypothetical protein